MLIDNQCEWSSRSAIELLFTASTRLINHSQWASY